MVDPARDRFSATATIDVVLDRARAILWLHGLGLHVTRATVAPDGAPPIDATWTQATDDGLASVTPSRAIPAGKARVVIEYDAPFTDGLIGLYRTREAGSAYVFSQFEPIDARRAFPCFDEPAFKVPFAVTLTVPKGNVAISNAAEIERAPSTDGTSLRFRFAPTLPLPTYLVMIAVGPLDVVSAPDVPPTEARSTPLPLRIVTAKGRGVEAAFMLAHAGEIVALLETYFGSAFPYEKLDLVAVPDRQGAEEHAGAITFSEGHLLFQPKTTPASQISRAIYVVAHETAHQWFGDSVTPRWWDDIWLSESFATWLGHKIADVWLRAPSAGLPLVAQVQDAIAADSLASARKVRQPITARGDIDGAFDEITYGKGGGVLSMFERWIGPEVFQRGVRAYLGEHANGSANAADFLTALSAAAGRDVRTPFGTFLDQSGVPFLEASVTCEGPSAKLHVKQSRFLSLGSKGDRDRVWRVPVCARYDVGGVTKESCTLVGDREGDVPLDGCPSWVMPNAGAAGYYRFALAADDLRKLRDAGLPHLTPAERLAYENALSAGFARGATSMGDAVEGAAPLVGDAQAEVVQQSLEFLTAAHQWLYDEPLRANVEAYSRRFVADAARRVGWSAAKDDDARRLQLRRVLLRFLALVANDPRTRADAKRRARALLGEGTSRDREVADVDLLGIALAVAGEDADRALFEAMLSRLARTDGATLRWRLIIGISSVRDPALGERALSLVLGDTLRKEETFAPLGLRLRNPATRERAWTWAKGHFPELVAKAKGLMFGGAFLAGLFDSFCSEERAAEIEQLFAPYADALEGGARGVATTVDGVRSCAATRAAQLPNARAFFARVR